MPRYQPIATSGRVAIAVCGRCAMKMNYNDLSPDRNSPGLMVCCGCNDVRDPYRLPARKSENIALRHPRPDEPLVVDQSPQIIVTQLIFNPSSLGIYQSTQVTVTQLVFNSSS